VSREQLVIVSGGVKRIVLFSSSLIDISRKVGGLYDAVKTTGYRHHCQMAHSTFQVHIMYSYRKHLAVMVTSCYLHLGVIVKLFSSHQRSWWQVVILKSAATVINCSLDTICQWWRYPVVLTASYNSPTFRLMSISDDEKINITIKISYNMRIYYNTLNLYYNDGNCMLRRWRTIE
jgi:hypothetical protein